MRRLLSSSSSSPATRLSFAGGCFFGRVFPAAFLAGCLLLAAPRKIPLLAAQPPLSRHRVAGTRQRGSAPLRRRTAAARCVEGRRERRNVHSSNASIPMVARQLGCEKKRLTRPASSTSSSSERRRLSFHPFSRPYTTLCVLPPPPQRVMADGRNGGGGSYKHLVSTRVSASVFGPATRALSTNGWLAFGVDG